MSQLKYFVGIDPGTTGAVAILDPNGRLTEVVDLPNSGPEPIAMDLAALLEAIGRPDELFLGIEMPFAVSAQASASALTQGIGVGVILGVVGTLGLRHERIKPADWKRGLGLPMGKGLTSTVKKRNSREHAARYWPDMAHRWEKASQDGRAEAALIGEHTRRRYLGQES